MCKRSIRLLAFAAITTAGVAATPAGVTLNSQSRYTYVDRRDIPTPLGQSQGLQPVDNIAQNSAPDFNPFSDGTYPTTASNNSQSIVSSLSTGLIQAKGDAFGTGSQAPGNLYDHDEVHRSHAEVVFTLSDPTPYQLDFNGFAYVNPNFQPMPVQLIGPGAQTLNFNWGTTTSGTLPAGQWKLLAEATSIGHNTTVGKYQFYDVTLALPEPGSGSLLLAAGALALRRRRLGRLSRS